MSKFEEGQIWWCLRHSAKDANYTFFADGVGPLPWQGKLSRSRENVWVLSRLDPETGEARSDLNSKAYLPDRLDTVLFSSEPEARKAYVSASLSALASMATKLSQQIAGLDKYIYEGIMTEQSAK